MEWAEKLKEEYSKVARMNQVTSTGGVNPQLRQNSDKVENVRTDEIVSKEVGLGSRDTYRKAEYIYNNADEDMII